MREVGVQGSRGRSVVAAAALLAGAVALSTAPATSSGQADACQQATVEVGIVKAVGCFDRQNFSDSDVYTATQNVDLNGFILEATEGAPLKITDSDDPLKWRVQTPKKAPLLTTPNYPPGEARGAINDIPLDFIPPASGKLRIAELFLGAKFLEGAVGGFSPVQVRTPIALAEDGKGSFGLTFELTGPFALKRKPQAISFDFETESGKGAQFEGFDVEIERADFFPPVNLEELKLKYSRAEDLFEGAANVQLPLFGGKGFGGGFTIKDGDLETVEVSASGLKVPIGEVAFLESIAGDFGKGFEVAAGITAGPEINVPKIGEVAALKFDGDIGVSDRNGGYFFLDGGLAVLRVKVAKFGIKIFFSGAFAFDASIGVGLPSFSNDRRQPFYLGFFADGWFDHQRFSINGGGTFKLFNVNLLKGEGLATNKGSGACWTVIGIPGGAVLPKGASKVRAFPVGTCGLGPYRQSRANTAAASAADASVRLFDRHQVIRVRGEGGAPRFVMRSSDGRTYTTPEGAGDGRGGDHVFFLDEEGGQTIVLIKDPRGTWTFEELPGSPPIIGVGRNEPVPEPTVDAEIRGQGQHRRLVWHARHMNGHGLEFVERLRGGHSVLIKRTERSSGSFRFPLHRGSHYGVRRLKVLVDHGGGPVMNEVVDRYQVQRPPRPGRPGNVRAVRDGAAAIVRWQRAPRAGEYVVRLRSARGGPHVTRVLPAHRRHVRLRNVSFTRRMVATVFAENRLGDAGRPGRARFFAHSGERSIEASARRLQRSLTVRPAGNLLAVSHCPAGGHCSVKLDVRSGGRQLDAVRVHQVPDTRLLDQLIDS